MPRGMPVVSYSRLVSVDRVVDIELAVAAIVEGGRVGAVVDDAPELPTRSLYC